MQNQLLPDQDIEAAIDRQPLIVSPTTPLSEVIVLMSQGRSNYCNTAISSIES
jgi:CBS domain containing-hemolysin-like protein